MKSPTFSPALRKIAILLLPFTLLLAACESINTLEFSADGTPTFTMTLKDSSGFLKMGGLKSCNDLTNSSPFADNLGLDGIWGTDSSANDNDRYSTKVVDKSNDKTIDCTVTFTGKKSALDGNLLKEEGDTLVFNPPTDTSEEFDEKSLEAFGIVDYKFSFTVIMPGKIISAEGANIDGNKATYDLAGLSKGIKVVAEKKSSPLSSAPSYTWIIAAGAVLALVAALGFFASRRAKHATPTLPETPTPPAAETLAPPAVATAPGADAAADPADSAGSANSADLDESDNSADSADPTDTSPEIPPAADSTPPPAEN